MNHVAFDPRAARLRAPLREQDYFAQEHVVVSYNGDLRGIVEDLLGKQRNARCSVPTSPTWARCWTGPGLLATIPALVARHIRLLRPHVRALALPFSLRGSFTERCVR